MKKKVIFLDRDGVINEERNEYTFLPEHFKILPDVAPVLKKWKEGGFHFIIISNQGGIAKGLYSENEVLKLHTILENTLKKSEVEILDFFFCPHHPDYNGKCLCRKPGSLLFERAVYMHNVDPSQSYMIGDKERDLIPAVSAGIKTFKTEANASLKKFLPLIH